MIVGERKLMIRTTKAAKHRIVRTWGVSSDEADATTEITISTTCRSIIRTCRERPSLYAVALPTPNAWVPQHSLCPDRSRKKHDPCLPRTQPLQTLYLQDGLSTPRVVLLLDDSSLAGRRGGCRRAKLKVRDLMMMSSDGIKKNWSCTKSEQIYQRH